MRTPNGQKADRIDKIMLLAMWADKRKEEGASELILAGMGKPTFPVNPHTISSYLAYWHAIETRAKSETALFSETAAINYGHPQGDNDPRVTMAEAMSQWHRSPISAENILFTVGGAGALRVVFERLNECYKDIKYRVITPFPHYTLYADNRHQLHPIEVMQSPGYRLTADALKSSIEEAYNRAKKDGRLPKAVLICNPSNPLGTVINEEEWLQLAAVLRSYPDLHIILDEAYAEMCFYHAKPPSLLDIAPDLKERTIILRSATKALSAAGERMALLIAFRDDLMGKFLDKNISMLGHAPRGGQHAYASTMAQFTEAYHQQLMAFYQPKVNYVHQRLQAMGATMPDETYQVEGTFYILGDFSDIMGLELPLDAYRALETNGPITTNEELAYYLLFQDGIMVAPASYFGLSNHEGFIRITCSGSESNLSNLMNKLEARLIVGRQHKKQQLINAIIQQLGELKEIDLEKHNDILAELLSLSSANHSDCLSLKKQIDTLNRIQVNVTRCLHQSTLKGTTKAATRIQSIFRGHSVRKRIWTTAQLNEQWMYFVNTLVTGPGPMKNYLLGLSALERQHFLPWQAYLKQALADKSETKTNGDNVPK